MYEFNLATVVFYLVSVLFHFPHAISIEQRFFSYIFNGQFTRQTIIIMHYISYILHTFYVFHNIPESMMQRSGG